MAVPKGRVSKSKRDKRKAQSWKIATPNLVKCSKCGELMAPHQVCKACGAYNKKTIIKVDEFWMSKSKAAEMLPFLRWVKNDFLLVRCLKGVGIVLCKKINREKMKSELHPIC